MNNNTNPQVGQVYQNDIIQLFGEGIGSSMIQRAKSRYKFDVIYTLEYFSGWSHITEALGANAEANVSSLLSKDWSPLSLEIYNQAAGVNKFIFCRLREYNNTEVGIEFQKELPLFEEYFMIQPASIQAAPQTVAPPPTDDTKEDDISDYIYTSDVNETTFTQQGTTQQLTGALAQTIKSGMAEGSN